jgi:hypothetical protein
METSNLRSPIDAKVASRSATREGRRHRATVGKPFQGSAMELVDRYVFIRAA